MTRLATVDLGTNTVRLLVVEADARTWRPLHQTQRVTRLGEGQAAAGRLLDGPMERTVAAVAEFVEAARRLGVASVRVVATSAVREAPNRADFVARVKAATGEEIQVISGAEEARLTLRAVAAGLPALGGSFLLLDIGGGSTEVVLAREGRPAAAVSLQLGVVPLAERFVDRGPVDWRRFAEMRDEVARRLEQALPPAIAAGGAPALVGTAGTVTTLAALDLGLAAYEGRRVHGHRLERDAVERLCRRLGALTLAERAALPCVEAGRADLLIPGAAICLAAMRTLGHPALVVSDTGLREGVLLDLLSQAVGPPR